MVGTPVSVEYKTYNPNYDYSTNLEKNGHILVSVAGIGVGGKHGGSQQNKTQRQAANEREMFLGVFRDEGRIYKQTNEQNNT